MKNVRRTVAAPLGAAVVMGTGGLAVASVNSGHDPGKPAERPIVHVTPKAVEVESAGDTVKAPHAKPAPKPDEKAAEAKSGPATAKAHQSSLAETANADNNDDQSDGQPQDGNDGGSDSESDGQSEND